MSILLEAIFEALFAGIVDGRRGKRWDLDDFFGKAFSVVIAFFAIVMGVYACESVISRDLTAYWLPFVLAFTLTAFCGALLEKRPMVYLAGGLAACSGPCMGLLAGGFVVVVDLMLFPW